MAVKFQGGRAVPAGGAATEKKRQAAQPLQDAIYKVDALLKANASLIKPDQLQKARRAIADLYVIPHELAGLAD